MADETEEFIDPTAYVTAEDLDARLAELKSVLATEDYVRSLFDPLDRAMLAKAEQSYVDRKIRTEPSSEYTDSILSRFREYVSTVASGTYRYMGSCGTYGDLPTSGVENGHVWRVVSTGHSYMWLNGGWVDVAGELDRETVASIIADMSPPIDLKSTVEADVYRLETGGELSDRYDLAHVSWINVDGKPTTFPATLDTGVSDPGLPPSGAAVKAELQKVRSKDDLSVSAAGEWSYFIGGEPVDYVRVVFSGGKWQFQKKTYAGTFIDEGDPVPGSEDDVSVSVVADWAPYGSPEVKAVATRPAVSGVLSVSPGPSATDKAAVVSGSSCEIPVSPGESVSTTVPEGVSSVKIEMVYLPVYDTHVLVECPGTSASISFKAPAGARVLAPASISVEAGSACMVTLRMFGPETIVVSSDILVEARG